MELGLRFEICFSLFYSPGDHYFLNAFSMYEITVVSFMLLQEF